MSRILVLTAVVGMMSFFAADSAQAQRRGFARGTGGAVHVGTVRHVNAFNRNRGFRGGFPFIGGVITANTYNSFHRPDNLPYFAKFPPVYYSQDIVKRPYGVSPFAAPAGVVPSEYHLIRNGATSQKIVNPYVTPAAPQAPSVDVEDLDVESAPEDTGDVPTPAQDPNADDNKDKKDSDWEIVPDKKT